MKKMPSRTPLRMTLMQAMMFAAFASGCSSLSGNKTPESPAAATTESASSSEHSVPAADGAQSGVTSPSTDADEDKTKEQTAHIYKGNGPLIRELKDKKAPKGGNTVLNFEAADIRDIAKTVLAELLKESYIVDPKVTGTISFRTTSPLPKEALLPTLETILRMNGYVMVKENGIFKIMPAASARGSLSPRFGGAIAGFTIQVVPLKYIGAVEMAKLIEPFAPDPSAIKVDELRNLLIIAGTQNEIEHMLDTISVFDVDWLSGMSVGLFTLQSADVKSVANEVDKIFGDKTMSPLAGVVRIVPIERLNAFVIITPQPHYLEQAKIWLERLDRVGSTAGTRLYVYRVQNGKAEHLANLLNQTFASKTQASTTTTPTPTVAPGLTGTNLQSSLFNKSTSASSQTSNSGFSSGFSNNNQSTSNTSGKTTGNTVRTAATNFGATLSVTDDSGSSSEVRVVADTENNALLILGNAAGYEKIESALKKLDVAPRQVLIEVTIAEVTLSDDLEYGVEWAFSKGSRKSGRLIQTEKDGNSAINMVAGGFSYALTNVTGDALKAVFNTLATDGKLNVLSSPHIMVADNQTAKIQVGDSVPTQTSSTTSLSTITTGTVTSTVQYLDTGVMLTVTPRINAGGLINLDVTQEVSSAYETDTSAINSPTIRKRSAQTVVTIQNGDTMVLGGLISERNNNGSSGIPFLSEIPILGAVFGKQTRTSEKTELVLLITPRVANNVAQAKDISDELQRKMGETKNLIDCGTSNILGFTTRGGPWCMQARRNDGAIDKMKLEDENGVSVYLKDEAKLEQENARRALDEVNRQKAEAQQRLEAATKRVEQTQRSSGKADSQASKSAATSATGDAAATATANKATTENTARKTPAPGKPKAKVVVPREPGVKAAPATPVVTPVESKAQATPPVETRDEPAPVVDPAQAVPAPASPE